ncbi:MAG: hypothetical protein QXR19_12105 [Candidatus Jordarchaeaceae archaeon]
MVKTNRKICVLGLAIILALLMVMTTPILLQNNPATFTPQNNIFTNTQTPSLVISKENPQPTSYWWNHSWNYRIEVNVTEPGYANRINEIAKVSLNFDDYHCANNSIRVLYYNHSTAQWIEVPIQIGNLTYYGGNRVKSCDLLFLCNVTKGSTSTYYVYYNDTYTGAVPTYITPLSVTINPGGTTYFTFDTGVISGNYTIRYSHTVVPNNPPYMYDDDACFRIFKVNGTNIIPVNGLHSGIDRIDADDILRWNSSLDQPLILNLTWTAELLESGPLRAIVRVYKTSFDRFTRTSNVGGGNYTGMNKTYTFYAYQGYVKIDIVNASGNYSTVPIYDFAVINVTNQWTLYIDTYNLGPATSRPWTDKISSPQAFNHMSLVRNDGLGFALLGSPMWPEDEFGNRTSLEYGYGYIDRNMQSFLFRNDGRPGDPYYGEVEYRIRIPFTYYIAGITQGFNQVLDTWYIANNPTETSCGSEEDKTYTLVANVTDWFYNPIPGANVTIYNEPGLSSMNKTGITNSQGLCTFQLNLNSTPSQYWIQVYQYNSYYNYTSNAEYWNPLLNFTYPYSTVNIRMNITTVYVEVWDSANHRLQNATVTLNYTDPSWTDISQIVDEFFANCSFYAWSNQNLNINITAIPGAESKVYVLFPNGTKGPEVTPPINTNEPKRFRVEVQQNITASPTQLSSNVTTILNKYWKDNITLYVWLKAGDPPSIPIYADSINFTIYYSSGEIAVPAIGMNLVEEGLYSYTFNTSTVGGLGLFGGQTYTITINARTNSSYVNPTPINIFLPLQNLPVEVYSPYSLENPIVATWFEPLHLAMPPITVRLTDIHNNLRVNNAEVIYTISGTTHVNEAMNFTGAGIYQVNETVVDSLTTGNFTISIVSSLQNYTIPAYYIKLTINLASARILAPSKIQGSFNENISVQVELVREDNLNPIIGANLTWYIQGTGLTGILTDPSNIGQYSGQIPNGTLTSGSYGLLIQASKENYLTQYEYITLEVLGASTTIGSLILIPQLLGGSSDYLFAGSLIQVENSWTLVPIAFTYLDGNGNPVPNATITVTGGLPVFDFGSGTVKGVGASEIKALQIGAGTYLVLVPISGFPPSTFQINIVAQAINYQTQQIPIVVSIKEKSIPLIPGVRIPLSTFLITLAAVAIPSMAFAGYSLYKRAKIPAIIKRIDELIRAISRGEKVTVKLVPREKVIAAILAEELAIVGVEPRVEGYVPVEIADLIVPLLVESGIQEKEAYALVPELKKATPSERERLLESVGVPGEISAKIIQTIEEFEEKREPLRKPRGKVEEEPTEKIEEGEEEPREEKKEREAEEAKEPEDKESEEQK